MEAIKVKGEVNNDNQLVIQLPGETAAGAYEVILVFLEKEEEAKKTKQLHFSNYELPMEGLTFSRSEIYGDDGR